MPTDIEVVRELIYDFYDSNPVVQENLTNQLDGITSTFFVNEYKARAGKAIWNSTLCESVSSTIGFTPPFSLRIDGTFNQAASSYSLTRGMFTTLFRPQATIMADYFFQLFTDADLSDFIAMAIDWMNLGVTSTSQLQPTQVRAVHFYAAYLACQGLIRRTNDLIDQAAGQVRANLNDIGKKYAALGIEMKNEATKMRDDFYKRSGQREAPILAYARFTRDAPLWTPKW